MATATARGSAAAGTAPRQAPLVLLALIVVAAVANLNLTVANVALPDIGRAFDAGQTALDLIAIGYSLGLAGSVLYLGALGDRYGRRMMLVAGVLLSVPACLHGRLRPGRRGAAGRPPARRDLRGHGVPHHPGPDHRALVGARPDQGHRPVVRSRRRDHRPGAAAGRPGPAALLVGISLPAHPAPGGGGPDPGAGLRAVTRQRDHRSRGQSGRSTVDGFRCGPGSNDQFRAGTGRGDPGPRHGRGRAGRGSRVLPPPAPGPAAPLRPARGGTADLLGGGGGRDHRLRVADGRDLRGPAVPAGRARLLAAARRAGDPPGGRGHGGVRAAVGPAHPRPRVRLHAAQRLRVLPAQLPHHAAAVEAGQPVLGRRAGVRVPGRRGGPGRNAGLALAHRLRPHPPGRDGLRHRRPAARPGRRGHAVDPGRAAHGRLRPGHRPRGGQRARPRPDHQQRPEPAGEVLRRGPGGGTALPAVRRPDHRGGEERVPVRRPVGLRGRHPRRAARRGAGVRPVPAQARGTRAAGQLPRRGRLVRPGLSGLARQDWLVRTGRRSCPAWRRPAGRCPASASPTTG